MSHYYQAQADDDANNHGIAVGRLQLAERLGKEANRITNSFPSSIPPGSNLSSDSTAILNTITLREGHLTSVQEKLQELSKDNDYI